MKKILCSFLFICVAGFLFSINTSEKENDIGTEKQLFTIKTPDFINSVKSGSLKKVQFNEKWGYLLSGTENTYNPESNITDICYFGAGINVYGELCDVPDRNKLSFYNGRVHLVVADSGPSFTHMVLSNTLPLRNEFIQKLSEEAKKYDGVQIDFETVPVRDIENYYSFLKELKKTIGDKQLSIAVPVRTKIHKEDAYNYSILEQIVDKIVVMAYDEHWSAGTPGPVASLDWCKKAAKYAQTVIPPEKLIMGIPLYGRAWSDDKSPGAYRMSLMEKKVNEEITDIIEINREKGTPFLKYKKIANIYLYYEDFLSIYTKLTQYKTMGIKSVAFWRLDYEDPDIWKLLEK